MEDVDDDFGVLYVDDVEFRAREPVGGLLGCSDTRIRPVGGERSSGNGVGTRGARGSIVSELRSESELRQFEVGDMGEDGDGREEEEGDGGSDSEDDLYIVVNDEDCRALAGLSMRSARNGGGVGDDADRDVNGVAAENGIGMNKRWNDPLMNGLGRDCVSLPGERGIGFKQLKVVIGYDS